MSQQTSGSNLEPEDLHALYEAIDDLWSCIGVAEIDHLDPETVLTAHTVHEMLWHPSLSNQ